MKDIAPFSLLPGAQYEMMSIAFGGKGRSVKTPKELESALKEMLSDNHLWVLNIIIDPAADQKPTKFSWLTTAKDIQAPKL